MPVENGTKIGRYEIRSLLGMGGMGEVYLAFDTKLERKVAIKLLTKNDNKEHLLRFKQEAKAIIALNHPHILTVHEFGQHENLHFIVTEYLEGKTLRDTLKEDSISLSDALEIGVQIANALSAAHKAGIVHRDIKPENIMILPDGYIKVLDFGLAKMTGAYQQLTQSPEASTASLLQTKAGMILGTVNYMSPEQLRGKEIDERTDIWSLGIVLFEAIGKIRPFAGDSIGDVIAAVIEHPTPMLANFQPRISDEIEEIISKSLQKDKTKRYQTAREFAADLKKAKIGIESGKWLLSSETLKQGLDLAESENVSLSSDTKNFSVDKKAISTNPNLQSEIHTQMIKRNRLGWSLVVILFLTLVGVGFYSFTNTNNQTSNKKTWNSRRLTTTGNVVQAVISPDEKLIAYTQTVEGKQSLWLKQVSETAGTELIKPASRNYRNLTFAPDSNSIYFVVFEAEPIGKLFKIPFLGSSPQKIAENVDSNITFSPDGSRFAFMRSITKDGINQIIVANADGTKEKVLAERKKPEFYSITAREGLDWSPDGKSIAVAGGRLDAEGDFMSVIEIDAETGVEKPITEQKWSRVGKVIWGKDGNDLYLTAFDLGASLYQIVRVQKRSGNSEKLTNELSNYLNISFSKNNNTLLSVVKDDVSNIFSAASAAPNQTRQIAKSNTDGINGLKFMPNGKIIYVSMESGNLDIWQMDAGGENRVQLSFDKAGDEYPVISADGKYIFFVSNRTGVPHIWRMNSDGSQAIQLTFKGGESFPTVSPDNKFVIYSARPTNRWVLMKIPFEGGEPVQITEDETHWASVSPDGKYIACLANENQVIKLALISMETGQKIRVFDINEGVTSPEFPPTIRWSSDSRNILYVSTENGISNIINQPIDSEKTQQLTEFSTDRIFSFDVSNDGKQFIYARGTSNSDIVLFEDFSN